MTPAGGEPSGPAPAWAATAPAARPQQHLGVAGDEEDAFELRLLLGEVAYFAYGSNMAPSVLSGRRRVRPRVSVPAAAPALRLSFGMLGFPFAEPAFATLVPPGHPLAAGGAAAPPAHGVLHAVSREEWAWICSTEGVGSSSAGYQVVEVECTPYRPGRRWEGGGGGGARRPALRAVTLQGAPASLHDSRRNALPSSRYLGLLKTGAAHHGLCPSYRAYLDALEPYGSGAGPSAPWRAAGAAAAAAVLASAAAPALPLIVGSRLLAGPPSGAGPAAAGGGGGGTAGPAPEASPLEAVSAVLGAAAMRATWAVHDGVLASVFGSGCSNNNGR
ncbi:MAG: hypothetical protein J3K34DRAFT_523335 [Monoraphidium minutum]|nr:MAG: hypothetical protein J3K34DRAFT_523335 [Monoraphidium minutum]